MALPVYTIQYHPTMYIMRSMPIHLLIAHTSCSGGLRGVFAWALKQAVISESVAFFILVSVLTCWLQYLVTVHASRSRAAPIQEELVCSRELPHLEVWLLHRAPSSSSLTGSEESAACYSSRGSALIDVCLWHRNGSHWGHIDQGWYSSGYTGDRRQ